MGTRSATTMLPTDDEVVLGLNEPDFKAHLANLKVSPHLTHRNPN
jgi:hypothetical protein